MLSVSKRIEAVENKKKPSVTINTAYRPGIRVAAHGSTARVSLPISIEVRDNGPGIEDLDALFEPFYTTKQPGDGVGLGLAISSQIVTDLGGRLTARNGQAGGAVFEMQLPIAGDDPKTQAAE